jgi:hypothetical protein
VKVYRPAVTRRGEVINTQSGVLMFGYNGGMSILRFTETTDGVIHWHPRTVPNRKTGKAIFIYDRIDIPASIVQEVHRAMGELIGKLKLFTPEEAAEWRAKKRDESVEARAAHIIKKIGGI